MRINHFAAIVLAAGFSSRMRRFKPLLPLDGENIADHLIRIFRENNVDVVLVGGYQQDRLRRGIKNQNILIVENPEYPKGMFTSVQAGLRGLKADYQAAFIAPVDIPLVRPSTIRRLLQAAEDHPDNILYPVFNKSRGHPPLIPAGIFPFVLECQNSGNLKSVLQACEQIAIEVIVPDSYTLFDIDTPADYKLLLDRFQHYEIPTPEECEVVIQICKLTPFVYRHSLKVAEIAGAIGQSLNLKGFHVNLAAVRAAALLHDIAKGQQGHSAIGAAKLHDMGFGKIADIVAVHTDLPEDNQDLSLEAKIVYLSDKLVDGETPVSLEERYQLAAQRYGTTEEIKSNIVRRRDQSRQVKRELEAHLGQSLEKIICGC